MLQKEQNTLISENIQSVETNEIYGAQTEEWDEKDLEENISIQATNDVAKETLEYLFDSLYPDKGSIVEFDLCDDEFYCVENRNILI